MSDLDIFEKIRDAIILEAAWLYEITKESKTQKDNNVEYIKVVWNRAFQRAGGAGNFYDLSFDGNDVKEVAKKLGNSKNNRAVIDITKITKGRSKEETNQASN